MSKDLSTPLSGIYGIFSKNGECLYIGQSGNIKYRWAAHVKTLKDKTHSRKDFVLWLEETKQTPSDLVFKVLEECENKQLTKNKLEIKWFEELKPKFWGVKPSLNYSYSYGVRKEKVKILKNCPFCSKEFTTWSGSKGKKYCSVECGRRSLNFRSIDDYPTKEELVELYEVRSLNTVEISKVYNCSQPAIVGIMEKYGIKRRGTGPLKKYGKEYYAKKCGHISKKGNQYCISCRKNLKRNKSTKILWPNVDFILSELESKTYLQLAQELGISDNGIRKYLKRNGVIPPKIYKKIQP